MKRSHSKQALPAALLPVICAAALLLPSCGGAGSPAETNVLIPVSTTEGYVYVNRRGELMKPEVRVDETSAFYDGYAVVGKDRKGYIDKSGRLVIPVQYTEATAFGDGLALVRDTGSSVIALDAKGREVFRLQDVRNARRFSEGLAAVLDGKKNLWGFVDKKGKTVIEPQFRAAGDFSCGLAAVSRPKDGAAHGGPPDVYGFINTRGKFVIEPQFDRMMPLYYVHYVRFTADGYCVVGKGEQMGVINKKGEFTIPPAECWFTADRGGFIAHTVDGRKMRTVYMDVKGKTLLEGFTEILPFNGGKYTVAMPDGSEAFVIIDRAGKTVTELSFSPVNFWSSFIDGMAVAQNDHYAGSGNTIINEKGGKVIDEDRVFVADDYIPYSYEREYFSLNTYTH